MPRKCWDSSEDVNDWLDFHARNMPGSEFHSALPKNIMEDRPTGPRRKGTTRRLFRVVGATRILSTGFNLKIILNENTGVRVKQRETKAMIRCRRTCVSKVTFRKRRCRCPSRTP